MPERVQWTWGVSQSRFRVHVRLGVGHRARLFNTYQCHHFAGVILNSEASRVAGKCVKAPAWTSRAYDEDLAHSPMECGNRGICDRSTVRSLFLAL